MSYRPQGLEGIPEDVGNASISTLGSLYGILGDPEAALGDSMSHVPKYTGNILYVDGVNGNDANSGHEPGIAKKTIGAAITAASAGDRIVVKASIYNEAINLNKDSLELVCEHGTFLTNTTPGTVLVVSANYCRVIRAILAQGGQTGLQVTGNFNNIEDCLAFGCSVGFDIGGAENHTDNCRSIQHTTTGFDITGSYGIHRRLVAAGAGAVKGIYLSANTADRNHFHDCHTLGNTAAGWEVVGGADNNLFSGCSMAVDDGARVDAGTDNTWDNFSEGSQIAAGQSRDQDLKDIYDLIDTAEAVGSYTYLDAGGEQDVYEDTTTTRRRICVCVSNRNMTQTGTFRIYRKVDGANYDLYIAQAATVGVGDERAFDAEFTTSLPWKITYEEDVNEGADRDIPYEVVVKGME